MSYTQMTHSARGVLFSYYDQQIENFSLNKTYLYRSISISVSQKKVIVDLPIIALTYDMQTQIGMTVIADLRNHDINEKGIEAAILLGLNLEISILPKYWWLYVGGSIGPQFISNAPIRQNDGFIFSDSAYAGNRFYIGNGKQIDLKIGLRHQSNAGISEPNGGINSLFLKGGVLFNL
ncbi:MAG: acyloxyacyl hydrolase [Saprospiraceae bacterium]